VFSSDGQPGQVLRIRTKKRIGKDNFVTAMRTTLKQTYGDQHLGLGGVFLIKSGKAKLHIMPDFSKTPLTTDDQVNQWLTFHEMSAPLVCLSVFRSPDPGLDVRVDHPHCFS